MKKRIIAAFLASALALGVSVTALAASFRDVPDTHWAARYIDEAAFCGYVEGVGGGLFAPEGKVTYAEFATMTARALFPDELTEEDADGEWYEPYVELCTKKGVFENTGIQTGIDADTPMTRVELAVTVANALRAAGAKQPGLRELLFVTVPDMARYSAVQREAIRTVYALDVMNGCDGNGTFCGEDNMTRAQAAAVLMRMSEAELDLEITPPETPDSETPGSENSDPETSGPEMPDPDVSDPETPDTETTEPEQSDPEKPTPEQSNPEQSNPEQSGPEQSNPEKPGPETPVPDVSGPEVPDTDVSAPGTPAPDDDARQRDAYEAIIAMKSRYPEGTPWTNANSYAWRGGIYRVGYGCSGFAFLLSDAAFGEAKSRMVRPVALEDVRVGDILRINNDTHSVIVLETRKNSVIVAEGNYNSSVHWGRELPRETVESASYMLTRYAD